MQVGIIGAGPIGLYTAFRLVKEGHKVVIFERSNGVAGNVKAWSFVKLFSKMSLNFPQDAKDALTEAGNSFPDDEQYLTGGEFMTSVLEPLAAWLAASGQCTVKTGCEVLSIGRGRLLKSDAIMAVGDKRRKDTKFNLLCSNVADGKEGAETFDIVIDASGSYDERTGNKVGIGGIPAPGERAAESKGLLRRTIPDVKGADKGLVAGKRVGVVGTGASAITCLRNLCDLAQEGGAAAPAEVIWFTRRPEGASPYTIMENDPLPQRSELHKFGNSLATGTENPWAQTRFSYVPAMACTGIDLTGNDALRLTSEVDSDANGEPTAHDLDVLFSLTGFHPDKDLWNEIHVHMCYASDGPMKLAQSLLAAKMAMEGGGADAGDCLKQAAPGPATLENPEPNFFVLGMKSYGRNSAFLMRVGYEQVGLLVDKLSSGE